MTRKNSRKSTKSSACLYSSYGSCSTWASAM